MKKLVLITASAILLITAAGCSSGRMASTGVYYDDIYYAPDLRQNKKDQAFERVPSITDEEKQKELKKEKRAQIREYEQSEEGRTRQDTRDFSEIQEKYASILSDEEAEDVDSLVYHNEETGYWVDGFQGSQMDRSYAERLVRFHGPFTRIPYSSPLYSEFVHFSDPYWNVYVDRHYAYAFPTWSNPWYDRYRYNRMGSPWGFGYSSWGYSSHWGYNRFHSGYYDPFYNPYHSYYSWGYHSPYYGYGYGSRYYHGSPYYGYYRNNKDHREVYKGIKPNMSSNTRYSGSTSSSGTLKKSRRDGNNDERATVSRRGTRATSDGDNTSAENRENTRSSSRDSRNLKSNEENTQRRSATRYRESGTSTGTVQTQSRRSSTPSYSQPENDSRPSYNRKSGYTRQVNTNTRSGSDNNRSETRKSENRSNNNSSSDRSVRSRSRSYNSGSSDNRRTRTRSYQPSQRSKSSSSSSSFNNSSNSSRSRSSSSYSGSSSSGSRSTGSRSSGSGSSSRSSSSRGGRR